MDSRVSGLRHRRNAKARFRKGKPSAARQQRTFLRRSFHFESLESRCMLALTWSIVPDGTFVHGARKEPASNSNLMSFLGGIYGANTPQDADPTDEPWFHLFQSYYDRWDELSGLSFVYEPYDDGALIHGNASPGVPGVRGDIRISGHFIDGQAGANTLAYNYDPASGRDMVIDTANSAFYSALANNSLGLRNVLAHELGHGIGLKHVCPKNSTRLMEPSINLNFDGPQFEDILAIQRLFGDVLEEGVANNSRATATNLGTLLAGQTVSRGQHADDMHVSPGETEFVSIHTQFDVDFYSFTVRSWSTVNAVLTPRGPTFDTGPTVLTGPDNSVEECSEVTQFNASAQSDLTLYLIGSDGSTLAIENGNGIGQAETLSKVLAPGTYYLRVTGSTASAQMYQLDVTASPQASNAQLLVDWRFDTVPGASSIPDSTGIGHPLSLSGMVAGDWVTPPTNLAGNTSALRFGSDSKFGTAFSVSSLPAESISFWIKPDGTISPASNQSVVAELGSRSEDDLSGVLVSLGDASGLLNNESITLVNQDTLQMTAISGVTLPANSWNHVAFVWNVQANRYDAYLNGESQPVSAPASQGHVSRISVDNDIRLGQRTYPSQRLPFSGAIDSFRLYHGVLTQEEIHHLASPFDAVAAADAATWNGAEEYSRLGYDFIPVIGDEFVRVDLDRSYRLSGWGRSGNNDGSEYTTNNLQYFGFASYDIDQLEIEPEHILKLGGSAETRLSQPLQPGDTIVHLESASGWSSGANGISVLAWYGYTDATGHTYPDYTYTRNILEDAWSSVDYQNNRLTLRVPWSGPTLPAGRAVRNHTGGPTYNYAGLYGGAVPNTWTKYESLVTGVGTDPAQFRHGTAFIKPIILANWSGTPANRISWREVAWQNANAGEAYGGQKLELDAQGVPATGTSLSYQWVQTGGPAVTLTGSTTATAEFTVPYRLKDYDLTFSLNINDGVRTRTDVVHVHVPAELDFAAALETKGVLNAASWNGEESYSRLGYDFLAVLGDDFVRVNTRKSYRLTGWARSGNDDGGEYTANNQQYFGFASFDVDKHEIETEQVLKLGGSAETRLSQPLLPGDTVVRLENAAGWSNGANGISVFAWYGYTDSTGYTYPDYTYTRNFVKDAWSSVDYQSNTLTLRAPWSGPALPAGRAVRNHTGGPTYNYVGLNGAAVPNAWTKYEGTIAGVGTASTQFRPGTAFIKPVILANWSGTPANRISWKDVEWHYARPWQNAAYPLDVNADGFITQHDADAINDRLTTGGAGPLAFPSFGNEPPPYYDVNGDDAVSQADYDLVINPNFAQRPTVRFAANDRVELHREWPGFSGQATYQWEQVAGTPVFLEYALTHTANFVAPTKGADQTLEFRVRISDGVFEISDTVTVVVEAYSELRTSSSLEAATWNNAEEYHRVGYDFLPVISDDFVSVDLSRSYRLTGWARSGNDDGSQYTPNNSQYFGFASYDIDQLEITPEHVLKLGGSADTRLSQPLQPGDTVVHLENAAQWSNGANGISVFAWYGYSDSTGHTYPDYTYTRNILPDAWSSVDYQNNRLTLRAPWSGPTIPAGRAVRNNTGGPTYNYVGLYGNAVPNTWTKYEGQVNGVGSDTAQFRPGTAFIKPILLANWSGTPANRIHWRDVEWNYARPWQNPTNAFDVNADGVIVAGDSLLISNRISSSGEGPLTYPSSGNQPPPYYDANGDDRISTADFVIVNDAASGFLLAPPRRFYVGDHVELHHDFPLTGGQIAYDWDQFSGPTVTLANADSRKASFTATSSHIGGDIWLMVTVRDGGFVISRDTIRVQIDAIAGGTSSSSSQSQAMSSGTGGPESAMLVLEPASWQSPARKHDHDPLSDFRQIEIEELVAWSLGRFVSVPDRDEGDEFQGQRSRRERFSREAVFAELDWIDDKEWR